ncbi:Glutathione S-transferase, partial [Bienertia sinuspersici]
MGVKVHGSPISTAILRVVAAVHEKELAYELVNVDMKSESRAITRYLAYTYENKGTPLTYKSGKEMADLAVWMEVEAHQFDLVASKLAWELVYKGMFGLQTDDVAVEQNEAKLVKVLDIYEARLAKSKYLAGDSFTLADLHHLPTLHYVMGTKVKKLFDERPHVSAWCNDILARPSWEKSYLSASTGAAGMSCYSTDFQEIEQIGNGNFSRVYKVLKRIDGCMYAITRALHYIHERGIAHIDVKPDNIYVKDGIYKLGDFGCATLLDNSLPIEEGDARYMPQEIFNKKYDHLDKVDIFSLGVSVCELLRGSSVPDTGHQLLKQGKKALLPGNLLQLQNLLK